MGLPLVGLNQQASVGTDMFQIGIKCADQVAQALIKAVLQSEKNPVESGQFRAGLSWIDVFNDNGS